MSLPLSPTSKCKTAKSVEFLIFSGSSYYTKYLLFWRIMYCQIWMPLLKILYPFQKFLLEGQLRDRIALCVHLIGDN
jgi:hypothetical protein